MIHDILKLSFKWTSSHDTQHQMFLTALFYIW